MMDVAEIYVAHLKAKMTQEEIDAALMAKMEADEKEIEHLRTAIEDSKLSEKEGWRYADELEHERKRLCDENAKLRADTQEVAAARAFLRERDGLLREIARLKAEVKAVCRTVESQHQEIVAGLAREHRMRNALQLCHDVLTEDGRDATVWIARSAMEASSDDTPLREMIEAARKEERGACIEDARTVGGSFAVQCEELIRARSGT